MTVTWQFFKLDARAITGLEASRAPARVSPLDESFLIDDRAVLTTTEKLKPYNDLNYLVYISI